MGRKQTFAEGLEWVDFETVRIETIIDNPHDLEKLIERLEQIKGMLPTATEH